jgi:hypothetical protein
MVRCMVATLTRTPWSPAHRAQCSAKVASGVASSWRRKTAAWAGPIRAARPGSGRGASEPRCRRWATYRCTVARPTLNAPATAAWVAPASTARTIRSRRSTEYGRITQGYVAHQPHCNSL